MKIKQENPCIHCGSYWHSLNTCFDYHDIYENYYDPLPKFYKRAGANKTFDKKHASCSTHSNKSVTDETDVIRRVIQRKFMWLRIVNMLRGSNKCGFLNLLNNLYCWLQGTRSRIFILNNGCSRINDIVITLLSKLDKIQAKDALKSVEN